MGEQKQRKKKRKKKQKALLKEKEVESQKFVELLEVLGELEKEKKYADVQICPPLQESKSSQSPLNEW